MMTSTQKPLPCAQNSGKVIGTNIQYATLLLLLLTVKCNYTSNSWPCLLHVYSCPYLFSATFAKRAQARLQMCGLFCSCTG